MPAWLEFVVSSAVVVVAGARLARDGDTIADRTGLGATWVGAILVAGATSLPEVATDISAVRQGEANLAIGDLFGSSMMNMLILAVADLLTRQARFTEVPVNQALVGALAISVTSIAAAGVLMGDDFTVFGVGWAPLAIGVMYVAGMRILYRNRELASGSGREGRRDREIRDLRRAIIGFTIAAAIILLVAPRLAGSAATLAEQWGIASGFFGMVFLAAATSLPEAAVVFAATRSGSHDLAVGNLLGSNGFNMLIFLILDVVDGPGSFLAQVDMGVVMGAVFATLLMAEVLIDMLNRAEHRVWYLETGPALMGLTYAAGLFLTYRATH
jgi:cation:H+ antiporter